MTITTPVTVCDEWLTENTHVIHYLTYMVIVGITFCLSSLSSLKQQFSKEMLIWQCHIVPADFYNTSASTVVRPGAISLFCHSLPAVTCLLHLHPHLLSRQQLNLSVSRIQYLYIFHITVALSCCYWIHLLARTSHTSQSPLTSDNCECFPGPLLTGVFHSVNNSRRWLQCAKISGGCHFLEQHVRHRQPHYI